MAYFAEIDEAGIVQRVIVVHDNDAPDEATGAAFASGILGGAWVQTFDDGQRGRLATFGDRWDGSQFISPTDDQAAAPDTVAV